MLIVDDSREKKPNKRPTELQRTRLPSALTDSDVIPKSLQYHSRRRSSVIPDVTPNVIPDVTPNVIPDVTPSVIPDVTPSVIPDVTPSVIPDVCNRESSQLKRRNPGFPLTTGGNDRGGTSGNDRRAPAEMTKGQRAVGGSTPISFPTLLQCHSRRPPQCHSRRHPSVIPDVTPNVIPDVTPTVIPDVCNRESSQLKRRNPGFPLTTGGNDRGGTGGNDRGGPAGMTEGTSGNDGGGRRE